MYFEIYLIAINIVSFAVWCTDKYLAQTGRRRVSEKTLFSVALAGGSVGAWAAMYTVRHKTKHKRFTTGIPLILIVQLAAILCYYDISFV